MIPYSTIAKTILVRSRIFHIFTRVENQPLKQRKRRIFLTYKTFSHSLSYVYIGTFFELTEGVSLEGSDDTPMYNPHILPLNENL